MVCVKCDPFLATLPATRSDLCAISTSAFCSNLAWFSR
uniref:Uncharacterized protein n=1 Tax=Anopheles albimanus TaxID=7167 RepID=A0A182FXX0_ANOAL